MHIRSAHAFWFSETGDTTAIYTTQQHAYMYIDDVRLTLMVDTANYITSPKESVRSERPAVFKAISSKEMCVNCKLLSLFRKLINSFVFVNKSVRRV